MNKAISLILTTALAVGMGIVLVGSSSGSDVSDGKNVEIRDGVQYITIDAKGGYWPKVSSAKAGIPTKLVVNTRGTYDCSAALVIRSIGYEKILPETGSETIDLGMPKPGKFQGLCSMGMYNFIVNFE